MPIDLENDSTVSETMAKLEAAEAAAGELPKEHFVQAEDGATREGEQPAPAQGQEAKETQPETTSETDTPAAAEKPPGDASPTEPKSGTKAEEAGSKFAKDRQRRDDSWKALNGEKEAFKAEKSKLEQERAALQREREQFEQRQAKAQAKYTPEQYEQAATRNADSAATLELQARGLEAQVREFEDDGKYTEAESAKARARELREQAAYQRGVARQLKEHAAQVRANPDPTAEQIKAKNAAAIRDMTMAAAKEWPDLLKEGSDYQKAVARNIQLAREAGLDENEFPVVRYQAAKMAALEAAAAGVPALQKDLAQARARVKELEALTAPGGGGSAIQRQPAATPKTDDEEGAELRTQALQM